MANNEQEQVTPVTAEEAREKGSATRWVWSDSHVLLRTTPRMCRAIEDAEFSEDMIAATPCLDWTTVWSSIGVGIAFKPRNEYAIEVWLLVFVITYRWRHGWWTTLIERGDGKP
jgi:hypothetical protein